MGFQERAAMLSRVEAVILPILRKDSARSRRLWTGISELVVASFREAGMTSAQAGRLWDGVSAALAMGGRNRETLAQIEGRLRLLFAAQATDPLEGYARMLARARRSFELIRPHLVGTTLLDLGAGSGLLAQLIHREAGMDVTLVDVLDYPVVPLPVLLVPQGERLPLEDRAVDTSLLYLMLHHADDPRHALAEAVRVTRRRLVVMEGSADDPDIHATNCFLDWFYNRVVAGLEMNVPANFRTLHAWREIFDDLDLALVRAEVLGVDEPLAPEHHVLFVLDRKS